MTRYIIRRILQAIPLLFIISVMIFVLLRSSGDPIAMMGGKRVTRSEDRERLTRLLGLDQPMHIQYITWLIGNDWRLVDIDGDGDFDAFVGEEGGFIHNFENTGNVTSPTYVERFGASDNPFGGIVDDQGDITVQTPNYVGNLSGGAFQTPKTRVVTAGEIVSWLVGLRNNGTGTGYNVLVTDTLANGYTAITGTVSTGTGGGAGAGQQDRGVQR